MPYFEMSGKLMYPDNKLTISEYNKSYNTLVIKISDFLSSKHAASVKKSRKPASAPYLMPMKKREVKAKKKALNLK
jgi:hypothetical protein